MRYLLVISKDPDTDYSGSFPDVPGCYATGQSAAEVQWRAYDALQIHLAGEEDHLPPARSIAELSNDPEAALDDPSICEMAWIQFSPHGALA
jgi:predicted RNase H-like HicB family nuclease